MTKEEASGVLKAQADYYGKLFESMVTAGDYLELWELEKRMEAIEMGADALRGAQPDPDTGLMPCGCGGIVKVAFYSGYAGTPDAYQVDCFQCHVGTRPMQTEEQAKAAWNLSHGYKEADK